jgi:histidyl-tRNA synthetase
MSQPPIQPRTLKGFRDFLPGPMLRREHLIDTAKRVFRSYGYSPIDTPALEHSDILLGKGSDETDKQLYRFDDAGGRDVAMRFDLTVPLARFMAQHAGTLGAPFKRYHVGPVWRGENTQRGRFREFLQSDFDTIGTESIVADIETGLVIHDLFTALGFEAFTIRLNNRKILTGFLEHLDLTGQATAVLRSLDKLPKIGREAVTAELEEEADVSASQADEILRLAALEGGDDDVMETLESLIASSETGTIGVGELRQVLEGMAAAGVPAGRVMVDVSIARGLDYYTGTVFETFLDALPDIGSCCSGGRYDDLASLYTKQRFPGVGASLGVDRLLAAMDELELGTRRETAASVLVVYFEEDRRDDYLALATRLRRGGLDVELYPEPRKIGAQLKYADRRGHRLAVIAGEQEWSAGTVQVKDLASGESVEVPAAEAADTCHRLLET